MENIESFAILPEKEKDRFAKLIKSHRSKFIRAPKEIVEDIFEKNNQLIEEVKSNHNISDVIFDLREKTWQSYLVDESKFNVEIIKEISVNWDTPKYILENLLDRNIFANQNKEELLKNMQEICGTYAGYISPYIYDLCLSNTQSRRSRAGKTFEQIIYKIYKVFGYPFVSQGEIGKENFKKKGLGKMVDSLLPSIDAFEKRRDKVVIGTMKTTLRERWQEVVEELNRTDLPSIYLLTMDEDISESKAEQMSKHNLILVVPKNVKHNQSLIKKHNIIDFETYFLEEIPDKINYWNNQ